MARYVNEPPKKDMSAEKSLPQTRFTRLAAALSGFALTAVSVWTLSSGLLKPPAELFVRTDNVALSLPYRGLCQKVSLSRDGEEIALLGYDVRAGLARLLVPLSPGRHELQVTFETKVPGLERTYPLVIEVDRTPPVLQLKPNPLLATQATSTVEETLLLEGETESHARLFLGKQEITVGPKGSFSSRLELQAGWNHLMLRVEDRAGNTTLQRYSIFRDAEDPEIVWQVAPGHVFDESRARMEFSIRDDGPLAAVTGTVDGKSMEWHRKSEDGWLGITAELTEGRHQVEIRVADQAGRVTTSQRDIVIDSSELLGEKTLGLGARGEDVLELHRQLKEAGYPVDEANPVFTAVTRQALVALQESVGLEVTGLADRATIIALGPRLVINLDRFSLVLERPGKPDRRWTIAAGSSEHPTPTGRFYVYEKVIDPTWLPPDSEWAKDAKPIEPGPDNPLGTRWIGLDWGSVGIHGTNAPWTVGSAVSHGCMRMETAEVEELYELVEVGTPVIVFDGSEDHPLLDKYWP